MKRRTFKYKNFHLYLEQNTALEWIQLILEYIDRKVLSKGLQHKLGLQKEEPKQNKNSIFKKSYVSVKKWLIKYVHPFFINTTSKDSRLSLTSKIELSSLYEQFKEEEEEQAENMNLFMLVYIYYIIIFFCTILYYFVLLFIYLLPIML